IPKVRRVVKAIKDAINMEIPIAWGTCIPRSELGFKASVVSALFGTSCIPKIRYHVYDYNSMSAAYFAGQLWCTAINMFVGSGGNLGPLAIMTGPFVAAAYCIVDDDRPWAYVAWR